MNKIKIQNHSLIFSIQLYLNTFIFIHKKNTQFNFFFFFQWNWINHSSNFSFILCLCVCLVWSMILIFNGRRQKLLLCLKKCLLKMKCYKKLPHRFIKCDKISKEIMLLLLLHRHTYTHIHIQRDENRLKTIVNPTKIASSINVINLFLHNIKEYD